MKLYAFASNDLTNIWAGIGAGRWAVGQSDKPGFVKGRNTKAAKMPIGSFGILYCNQTQSLTTPFVVYSKADTTEVVIDIWKEPWVLPFSIKPLGTPARQMTRQRAKEVLPCLVNNSFEKCFLVQGQFSFQSSEISDSDWEILIQELAI